VLYIIHVVDIRPPVDLLPLWGLQAKLQGAPAHDGEWSVKVRPRNTDAKAAKTPTRNAIHVVDNNDILWHVCSRVCVCEREREREREHDSYAQAYIVDASTCVHVFLLAACSLQVWP